MRTHIAAAKAIREELKSKYPNTSFSVRADSYSLGDAVSVAWTDGPTINEIERIIGKYQYGHFDGLTDYYDLDNKRDDLPQVKYTLSTRNFSNEAVAAERAIFNTELHIGQDGKPLFIEDFQRVYEAFQQRPDDLIHKRLMAKSLYQRG